MSASREKKNRQEQISAGWSDPKTAREAQQRKQEKRSNALYGVIAAVFIIAAVISIVWRSNIISKTATAVTIDGEKYTAAEVNFYYQNAYRNTVTNLYSYGVFSYVGLDTSVSLKDQTVSSMGAMLTDATEGETWHSYFLDKALEQMATVQAGLKAAEAEGFIYPAGVQAQYDDSISSLKTSAAASGLSVEQYLQSSYGSGMTESIYGSQLLRMLQYSAYADAYEAGLTYTDAELTEAYNASRTSYDKVSYEAVTITGAAESTTDADGNTVEPTEEEEAAAKETAKTAADEMLASFQAGESLKAMAEDNEKATYTENENGTYSGNTLTEWLFDSARKAGDTAVLEDGSTYYVAVFHERFRDEYPTIDVRHILIQPASGELTASDEGYDEEQAQLDADAKAKAEDILAQWQAGEATEASFAQLAMENSVDGSKYDGGLYTRVYQGQMVTEFADWCFDASRKSGDTGIVKTDYGYHVMYFVGEDLPRWQAQVAATLESEDYETWVQALSADSVIEQHDLGMKFVG